MVPTLGLVSLVLRYSLTLVSVNTLQEQTIIPNTSTIYLYSIADYKGFVNMKKKLAIIGRGTAGCLAMANYLKWVDCEIDWYFDEEIKPQAVGEGAQLDFPRLLEVCLGFYYSDLPKIDGTIKLGIRKMGWGNNSDFYHNFQGGGNVSYHFNASKLQGYIFNEVKNNPRVTLKQGNVGNHDSIDADFIMDCSGFPKNYDDFNIAKYISVNAVHVTQCYWDHTRFNHTITMARPHGWVFGIPLQNRCSIGYMYNHEMSSLEEVKEDVKEVFKNLDLTPSNVTNSFKFKNFYRKENFSADGRVAYNGNASFFLEPMEATTISVIREMNKTAFEVWAGIISPEVANKIYTERLELIEREIMIHYYAGSPFNTKFWDYAKHRGELAMRSNMELPQFLAMLERAERELKENGMKHTYIIGEHFRDLPFATWSIYSWKLHIHELGVLDRLLELRKEVLSQ
jgi:tryptophan halogenase